MDEKLFSLIVAMFVSRSTRTFDCPEDDFKVAQRKFGDFNLVFLVSFLSLPALPTGTTLFAESTKDGSSPHPRPNGCTEFTALSDFYDFRDQLKESWIEHLVSISTSKTDPPRWILSNSGKFFRQGIRDATPEMTVHLSQFAPYYPILQKIPKAE